MKRVGEDRYRDRDRDRGGEGEDGMGWDGRRGIPLAV